MNQCFVEEFPVQFDNCFIDCLSEVIRDEVIVATFSPAIQLVFLFNWRIFQSFNRVSTQLKDQRWY